MTEEPEVTGMTPYDPYTEWTDAQWRDFVQEASNQELAAIIEKGRRITLFHRAFNQRPWRWDNRDWRIVCREVIGISQPACSYYEKITGVFGTLTESDLSIEAVKLRDGLPTSMYSLYQIACAYELGPDVVFAHIGNGSISSETTQEQAKDFLRLVRTGEEIAQDELPQTQQDGAKKRSEKIEPQIADVVVQGLANYLRLSVMKEDEANFVLYMWMRYPDFFDMLQSWRKKYGDRDLDHTIRWLLGYSDGVRKTGGDGDSDGDSDG